jgi:integrase/recombinase XerD
MSAALRLVRDAGGGDDLPPIEAWEVHMRGAGLSDRTVTDGVQTLQHLERFAGKTVETMTALDVSRFLGRPNLKAWSRSAYFSRISRFYRWYADNGGVNITVRLPRPKMPKSSPRPISDDELRTLLLETSMRRKTRVMILLAAFAGLRVHEIAKVRGEDVDPMARTLRVTGKGNVTATLPLHPLLVDAAASMPQRGWWFPGNSTRAAGLPIARRSVSEVIQMAMARAGIPGGTAHRLRHWYGTRLVGDGADLRTAQTLLRHANLNTTAIYVQVSDPKRVEAIDRLDPFGGR